MTAAISETLGTQKVKQVSQEEALLIPELTQRDYDELTVNLRFEPGSIKDYPLDWTAQGGLVENMAAIVQEFKTVRKLQVKSLLSIFLGLILDAAVNLQLH